MSLDPQSVPFLRSCERCRQKKRKCGGQRPSCAWCSSHSIPCRYRRTQRFKKQLQSQPTYSQPTASFSADALARLLAVDMVPHMSPQAGVLNLANAYMTPLGGSQPGAAPPAWAALGNVEAGMLASLGDAASAARVGDAGQAGWMPVALADPAVAAGLFAPGVPPQINDVAWDPALAGLQSASLVAGAGWDSALAEMQSASQMPTAAGHSRPSFPSAPAYEHTGSRPAAPLAPKPLQPRPQPPPPPPQQSPPVSECPSNPTPTPPPEQAVPAQLTTYLSSVPDSPSPTAIYTLLRATFRAPRTGMVSMNHEMLWFMLHRNVLPRIVFYGHISSTLRCSVVQDTQGVPAHLDESCYRLALREVPLVRSCSEVWGAVALCMLARYEFQSARYAQMAEHANMALDVMHRVVYRGCAFPWRDVIKEEDGSEEFVFQYVLAIYWKCFLWKLVSLMLIEGDARELAPRLDALPAYSSRTYDLYTTTQPYCVDMLSLLPPGSWQTDTENTQQQPQQPVWFRGPHDQQFMRSRPAGSPCFDRGSLGGFHQQQLLVVFARFLVSASSAQRTGGVGHLLRALEECTERMRAWRTMLPAALVLDGDMVAAYQLAIRPGSAASVREIDLRAARVKEAVGLLLVYHTFVVRANRLVMKRLLGERMGPAPDVVTGAFGVRDLYDCPEVAGTEGLGVLNMRFHGCRLQAAESASALCSLVQAFYACRFNLYTLGSPVVFAACELLAVSASALRNRDAHMAWRAKARLSNVFNVLRMLRHWAPALHVFVAGIRVLSDPLLCLDEPSAPSNACELSEGSVADVKEEEDAVLPVMRRRGVRLPGALESVRDARTNILHSIAPRGVRLSTDVRRDETLSYRAADPVPEFPNPFPKRHVISLIIGDLGLSLAEFLAPAYPILLLKLGAAGTPAFAAKPGSPTDDHAA